MPTEDGRLIPVHLEKVRFEEAEPAESVIIKDFTPEYRAKALERVIRAIKKRTMGSHIGWSAGWIARGGR